MWCYVLVSNRVGLAYPVAFVRGFATWGCYVGYPFISAEKFDWHVGAVLEL